MCNRITRGEDKLRHTKKNGKLRHKHQTPMLRRRGVVHTQRAADCIRVTAHWKSATVRGNWLFFLILFLFFNDTRKGWTEKLRSIRYKHSHSELPQCRWRLWHFISKKHKKKKTNRILGNAMEMHSAVQWPVLRGYDICVTTSWCVKNRISNVRRYKIEYSIETDWLIKNCM